MSPTVRAANRVAPAAAVLSVLAALSALSACTSDDTAETGSDPEARLEAAREVLDEAASLQIRLATDSLPDGAQGLVEADGVGTHQPAFEGTVKVQSGSFGLVDAELVSVSGDVVAKIGFVPDFTPVDPADFGAPDPADLVATEGGVSSWLTATEGVGAGEQSRDGEDVVTTVSGTLPGDVVAALIPSADQGADFDVDYRLSDDDVLRDARITGPFYAGTEETSYDLEVTASDEAVDITLP